MKQYNILKKGKDEVGSLSTIVVIIVVLAVVGVGIYFALKSGPKAEFEVTTLTLSPAEAKVGQTVTVSVAVKNIGDAVGTHEFPLTIDGEEVEVKEVTLAPDETKTITFTMVKNVEGTYTVGAGGLTKSLNVNPLTPATFVVSNLSFNPSEVEVGKPVVISATVKNVGELEGTYTVELRIDGATEATKDVALAGGATETVSFTVTKDARGTYTIGVDGLQRTLSVLEPATFELTNLTISPTEVKLGDSVEISVDVRNTGDMSGTYTVTLRIGGITEATKDVTLTGGATETASFTVMKNEAKTYSVTVDGLAGSFTVKPFAGTITLHPIADAYIDSDSPANNFGGSSYLDVDFWDYTYIGDVRCNSYLMSDLSSIPSGATVTSAKLELYAWSAWSPTATVGAHYCSNNSWTETGITWNNAPAFASTPTDTVTVPFDDAWYSWDITSDVQSALSVGKLTTVIRVESARDGFSTSYYSKDGYRNPPRLVISYTSTSEGSTSEETFISRDFGWEDHLGETWTWSIDVEQWRYEYYQGLSHRAYTTGDYLKFVTYEDGQIKSMADKLVEVYSDPEDAANCILAFVQTGFPYTPEDEEYWRYPVETLVDNGDCEDKAVLFASIMKAAEYDVALIVFDDHAMAGVVLWNEPKYGIQEYIHWFTSDGKRYYTCETTAEGWRVGDLPEECEGESAHVLAVN